MPISYRDSLRARALAVAAVVVGMASLLPAAAPPPPGQAGGNKTVYVAALDADKKPVAGLTKDSWGVREDGTDRTIVDLKPATDPLSVVLMIDTSQTSTASIADLRAGLEAFADTLFAGSAPVSLSIMDVAAADVMVATNKTTAADANKVLTKTFADRAGQAAILEGLVDASKALAKAPSARRAIVVVNMDGVPEFSTTPGQKVIQAIVASGASVWAVTYQNPATMSLMGNTAGSGAGAAANGGAQGGVGAGNNGEIRDVLLQSVPEGTGGLRTLITVPSALRTTIPQVAADLVAQYALTYVRPDGPTPKNTQMAEMKPGVTVLFPSTPIK
jgi:hypothetical protein